MSGKAVCRLHQNLFKDILKYEDTSASYPITEKTPYLEYTVDKLHDRKGSRCVHAVRTRRNTIRRQSGPIKETGYCDNGPYESLVNPNEGLQNAV